MKTQKQRLNPEPLAHCSQVSRCTYPVCNCYDAETITAHEADQLLIEHIEPMLAKLRIFLDDLKGIITKRPMYVSFAQLQVYRKRRARLQKNFIFWKIKYDLIKHNKK
jgi:hypothetical protein